jgi:hypothetical protein
MPGVSIKDIGRMHKGIEMLEKADERKKKEVMVWKDVGIFRDLFPEDRSSVEILQELRRR